MSFPITPILDDVHIRIPSQKDTQKVVWQTKSVEELRLNRNMNIKWVVVAFAVLSIGAIIFSMPWIVAKNPKWWMILGPQISGVGVLLEGKQLLQKMPCNFYRIDFTDEKITRSFIAILKNPSFQAFSEQLLNRLNSQGTKTLIEGITLLYNNGVFDGQTLDAIAKITYKWEVLLAIKEDPRNFTFDYTSFYFVEGLRHELEEKLKAYKTSIDHSFNHPEIDKEAIKKELEDLVEHTRLDLEKEWPEIIKKMHFPLDPDRHLSLEVENISKYQPFLTTDEESQPLLEPNL